MPARANINVKPASKQRVLRNGALLNGSTPAQPTDKDEGGTRGPEQGSKPPIHRGDYKAPPDQEQS
jgi:hypothetical protein